MSAVPAEAPKLEAPDEIIAAQARRITKARFQIITDKRMTFFGVVVMNLKPVAVTHILSEKDDTIQPLPTAATDGLHLFYNPIWFATLTDAEVKGVICHEVGHVTGFHFDRQGARKMDRWNLATDIKINTGLRDIKITLPKEAQYGDHRHTSMTAEEVYQTLKDQPQGKGGQADPGGCGTFMSPRNPDGSKMSASEARAVTNKMRGVVEEAARMAKAQGSMPQFIERLINDSLHEPLSWQELLRRFATQHIRVDYTWRRPARRMMGQLIYLPSQKVEGVAEVVIGVDTSGSISQPILSAFAKEVQAIADQCQPERIHVVYCDAAVQRVEVFERGEEIVMKAKGGGGTDFSPVFRWVEEQGMKPLCLIYFTDLLGSFPKEPDYPVMWAATMDGHFPWGEKILLNDIQG